MTMTPEVAAVMAIAAVFPDAEIVDQLDPAEADALLAQNALLLTDPSIGPCALCHEPHTRYGDNGSPLCPSCIRQENN